MNDPPELRVTLHPLTVSGSNFHAGEHVTVVANVPPHMVSSRAVASGDGSFVVTFDDVDGAPPGLSVRASGSEGSGAIYAPRPARTSPPARK